MTEAKVEPQPQPQQNFFKEWHNYLYESNFTLYVVIFILLVVILICVIVGFGRLTDKVVKKKKESYSPVASQASKVSLGKPSQPTAITNQIDAQMETVQQSFDTVQQSGNKATINVANQTTFNGIEGIIEQNLATKGYMNERDAKAKEAAMMYVWENDNDIPDSYDPIVFNPYAGPSFASGQSGIYAGLQELQDRAERVEVAKQAGVQYKKQQWLNNLKNQQSTIFNQLKNGTQ